MKATNRNISIDIFRILMSYMIVLLHLWGQLRTGTSSLNQHMFELVNSICNIAVSGFILMSGYFGVHRKFDKIVFLIVTTSGYSLLAYIFKISQGEIDGIFSFVKSCFPVFFNQNWYVCCYIALILLSPYVNGMLDAMKDKKQFLSFIATLLLIFSIIPTFFYYELPGTKCKGLFHILLMYSIGRYIAKYRPEARLKKRYLIYISIISLLIVFILDVLLLHISGTIKDYFARDCSLFIIVAATSLFALFVKDSQHIFNIPYAFKRGIIYIAGLCFDVYLLHDALIIPIFNKFLINILDFGQKNSLIGISLAESGLIFVTSILVACVMHPIYLVVGKNVYRAFRRIYGVVDSLVAKLGGG